MGATINRESVIKGACLALAHAAQMLDDSSLLYQFRRFSSSFCLAVSAREELGRLHLLWGELRDLNSNGVKEAKVLVLWLVFDEVPLQKSAGNIAVVLVDI